MLAAKASPEAVHAKLMNAYYYEDDIQITDAEFSTFQLLKGQLIFSEGMTPQQLFYVESGSVKIYKTGCDGKELILKIAKRGDFVGYRNLLTETRYDSSAETLEPSALRYIPKSDFQILYDRNPDLQHQFARMLAEDLAQLEHKIVGIAYTPVAGRLAESLLALAADENGYTKEINLSRLNIAKLIGTTKESVIRLLSELRKDGLVEIHGHKVHVKHPEALAHLRDMYI